MKVKVINSIHGHVVPGMIGEVDYLSDPDFPGMEHEVTFTDVENLTTHKRETVIVMLQRQDLEEVKDGD